MDEAAVEFGRLLARIRSAVDPCEQYPGQLDAYGLAHAMVLDI